MANFNDLLRNEDIDPHDVILVRHSGVGHNGLTPHDLWIKDRQAFELYQSTQEAGRRIFNTAKMWASFVAEPNNTTLFVGLYRSELDDPVKIDWNCPLSEMRPGAAKGNEADLFHLEPLPNLVAQRARLRIHWSGGERAWVQYAHLNEKAVDGVFEVPTHKSSEGKRIWEWQLRTERSARLGLEAKRLNAQRYGGSCQCESCDFSDGDRAMFDAHHIEPLHTGIRDTGIGDFLVLCPTCHRRAHRSLNRLLPFSLDELRNWIAQGRP